MKKLIIKNESIWRFITGKEFDERRNDDGAYHLMKDEIIIPKDRLPNNETQVTIELDDYAREKRSKLTNTYVYKVEEYDSISYKLSLIDFMVKQKEL